MARTKQLARKGPRTTSSVAVQVVEGENRSTLLQLMGFPVIGAANALTVQPNWPAVTERLKRHPTEAAAKDSFRNCNITPIDVNRDNHHATYWFGTHEKFPILLALTNENVPLTKDTLDAFIEAYPDIVTNPRSTVMAIAYQNPNTRPEVIETLFKTNSHLCRPKRTTAFQMMGFPAPWQERPGMHYCYARGGGYQVDWEALEHHLEEHPIEAKITCIGWQKDSFIFPLEAALFFQHPPIPLSTVQLLLRLCPEAATIPDSSILYLACTSRRQEDPEVIRAILNSNPSLAGTNNHYITTYAEQGLPITEAVNLPCALQILPDLIRASPCSISSENQERSTALQIVAETYIPRPGILKILLEAGHRNPAGFGDKGQLYSTGTCGDVHAMENIVSYSTAVNTDEIEYGVIRWENFCLGIQAAGAFQTGLSAEAMWDYPLLQAVIEFGEEQCNFEKIFRESHPDDFTRVDAMGRTPLIVAINVASDIPDNEMIIQEVIQMLLNDQQGGSSQAAEMPIKNSNDGSTILPLHYALRLGVGFDDGLGHIVDAFPGALDIVDPETKLLPFLSAAVGAQARVNTIYALAMERPNMISSLCISAIISADVVAYSAMEE